MCMFVFLGSDQRTLGINRHKLVTIPFIGVLSERGAPKGKPLHEHETEKRF